MSWSAGSAGKRVSGDWPWVSIVTPSFNHAAYLERTIESVLSQDYPHIEYIVRDGGSTDGSAAILERYGDRLTFVSRPDGGQSAALNAGFAASRGEILTWLNSDDTLRPGAVGAGVRALLRRPDCPLVYGHARFVDERDRDLGRCVHIEPYRRSRLREVGDFIVQPAAFFRRSAYEQVGGLDDTLHYAMDYDLWLKLAELGPFAYFEDVLANYRWLSGSKTAQGGQARLDEVLRVARRHGLEMPAWFKLEQVRADVAGDDDAKIIDRLARLIGNSIGSPGVVFELMQPRTWQTFLRGRSLRH